MRLTIRGQLAFAFAVPLALLVLSTALAMQQLSGMKAQSDDAMSWATTRAKSREVMLAIITYRLDVRGYVLYHDAKNHLKAETSQAKVRGGDEIGELQRARRAGELAAGIEEMSATANALLEHAEGLRRVVSAFRIDATIALPNAGALAVTA